MTQIKKPIISKIVAVADRDSVTIEHLYRIWHLGNQKVTWPMTSHDPERSRSWSRYIWMQISGKQLKTEVRFQWDTN